MIDKNKGEILKARIELETMGYDSFRDLLLKFHGVLSLTHDVLGDDYSYKDSVKFIKSCEEKYGKSIVTGLIVVGGHMEKEGLLDGGVKYDFCDSLLRRIYDKVVSGKGIDEYNAAFYNNN